MNIFYAILFACNMRQKRLRTAATAVVASRCSHLHVCYTCSLNVQHIEKANKSAGSHRIAWHRIVSFWVSFYWNPIKYAHNKQCERDEGNWQYNGKRFKLPREGGYIYCIVGYKAHDSPIEHVGAHVMRVVENANHGDGKQRQYAASHIDAETATCN